MVTRQTDYFPPEHAMHTGNNPLALIIIIILLPKTLQLLTESVSTAQISIQQTIKKLITQKLIQQADTVHVFKLLETPDCIIIIIG